MSCMVPAHSANADWLQALLLATVALVHYLK